MMNQELMSVMDEMIKTIAKNHLRLETLETRNSDSLDFSDQAVWSIKSALEAAYACGYINSMLHTIDTLERKEDANS